jgi:LmbE family N-acetylglucosaminyl deacetylase/CheY-like chemotaxis protein
MSDATRILLVEGDDACAEAIVGPLQEVAEITRVGSAEQAEELLLTRDWNVLIAEADLPGLDGLELVRAGRLSDPELVALVVSGHERFADAVEAMRAGASDFITRPIATPELLTKVRRAVELDRAHRARRGPGERVLAIGAHPDDVEIGCGGVLLHHRDATQPITILTLTAGEAGGDRAARVSEAMRPAALLSARLNMRALEDTDVAENGITVEAISEAVTEVRPTTIYTHSSNDVHRDHRNVHSATLVAARKVPRVYAYQSPSATVEFRPSRFVSIDDVLERKLELIQQYWSQTSIRDYLAPDLLRASARYWGRFGSSNYAEPFEVIRDGDIVATTATAAENRRERTLDRAR